MARRQADGRGWRDRGDFVCVRSGVTTTWDSEGVRLADFGIGRKSRSKNDRIARRGGAAARSQASHRRQGQSKGDHSCCSYHDVGLLGCVAFSVCSRSFDDVVAIPSVLNRNTENAGNCPKARQRRSSGTLRKRLGSRGCQPQKTIRGPANGGLLRIRPTGGRRPRQVELIRNPPRRGSCAPSSVGLSVLIPSRVGAPASIRCIASGFPLRPTRLPACRNCPAPSQSWLPGQSRQAGRQPPDQASLFE